MCSIEHVVVDAAGSKYTCKPWRACLVTQQKSEINCFKHAYAKNASGTLRVSVSCNLCWENACICDIVKILGLIRNCDYVYTLFPLFFCLSFNDELDIDQHPWQVSSKVYQRCIVRFGITSPFVHACCSLHISDRSNISKSTNRKLEGHLKAAYGKTAQVKLGKSWHDAYHFC